jgi:serine/threonine-protein kinase
MKADTASAAVFDSSWTVASVQRARVAIARGQATQALPPLTVALQKYQAQAANSRDVNDEVELQFELGRALIASERAAEALPHLERVLTLRQTQYAFSPRLAEAQVALADCRLRLGDVDASRALLSKAKAIHAANRELGDQYRKPLAELQRALAATN